MFLFSDNKYCLTSGLNRQPHRPLVLSSHACQVVLLCGDPVCVLHLFASLPLLTLTFFLKYFWKVPSHFLKSLFKTTPEFPSLSLPHLRSCSGRFIIFTTRYGYTFACLLPWTTDSLRTRSLFVFFCSCCRVWHMLFNRTFIKLFNWRVYGNL